MALLSPSMAGIHPWHLQEFILIQTPSTDGANHPRYKSPFPFPSPCPAAAAPSERERRSRVEMVGELCGIPERNKTYPKITLFSKGERDGSAPTAPEKRGDHGMSFPHQSCHSHGISVG